MFINCSKYNETDGDCKGFYAILAVCYLTRITATRLAVLLHARCSDAARAVQYYCKAGCSRHGMRI